MSGRLPPEPPALRVGLLIDTTAFAGTERHMLDLAGALRAEGVAAEILCPAASPLAERSRVAGVPVAALPAGRFATLRALLALPGRLRRGELDLLHSHNGRTALLAALATALAGRGRTVTTQHFLRPARLLRRGLLARAAHALHRWVLRRAGRVIAISGPVRAAILERGEVAASSVTTVWNGLADPAKTLLRPPAEVRAALGLSVETPLLVCAARLEAEKRLEVLLEAMPAVLRAVPSARLLIAGEGQERTRLQARLEALGLAEAVRLLGFQAEVLSLVQAADVFTLPSEAEPFGLSLVEAMALSRPVVATRAGGPLEIIVEEESGLLVPPGDPPALAEALVRLLRQPEARARLGANARTRFEQHFTAARMAARMRTVYEEILALPARP